MLRMRMTCTKIWRRISYHWHAEQAKETYAKYNGAFAATAKTIKAVIADGVKIVMFDAKHRKPIFALGIELNAANIAIWATEVRK